MNKEPHDPSIEPELEARIIALVLGEASDFETEELNRLIKLRPELAAFKLRMESVHGLLREVGAGEFEAPAEDWKLPADKRNAVLAVIRGEATIPAAIPDINQPARQRVASKRSVRWRLTRMAAAAGVCVTGFVGLMAWQSFIANESMQGQWGLGFARDEDRTVVFNKEYRSPLSDGTSFVDGAESSLGALWYAPYAPTSDTGAPRADTRLYDVEHKQGTDGALSGTQGLTMSEAAAERASVSQTDRKNSDDALLAIRSTLDTKATLPDATYLDDDVQYFDDGPEFKLHNESTVRQTTSERERLSRLSSAIEKEPASKPQTEELIAKTEERPLNLPGEVRFRTMEDLGRLLDSPASVAQSNTTWMLQNDALNQERGTRRRGNKLNMPEPQRAGGLWDKEVDQAQSASGRESMRDELTTPEIAGLAEHQVDNGLTVFSDPESNSRLLSDIRVMKRSLMELPIIEGFNGQTGVTQDEESRINQTDQDVPHDESIRQDVESDKYKFGRKWSDRSGELSRPMAGAGVVPEFEPPVSGDSPDATVPDSGTLMLGGIKRPSETLSSPADVAAVVVPEMMMVTPRIIIDEDEESVVLSTPDTNSNGIAGGTATGSGSGDGFGSGTRSESGDKGDRGESAAAGAGVIVMSDGVTPFAPYTASAAAATPVYALPVAPIRETFELGKPVAAGWVIMNLAENSTKDSLDSIRGGQLQINQESAPYTVQTPVNETRIRSVMPAMIAEREISYTDLRRKSGELTTNWIDGRVHGQSFETTLERQYGFRPADKPNSMQRSTVKRVAPSVGLNESNATEEAFSTFSLHVSDVSFKLALAALGRGEWPEAAKVRIEEFVNAFDYGDPMPCNGEKVACAIEQSIHPFVQQRNLLRVSMRTAAEGRASSTPLRLTFLLDNSGSMERIDRQQTVRRAFALLAQQLTPIDQVTLISFARQPRLLADRVSGNEAGKLVGLIDELPSEGGTNIEAALQLAFEKAREQQTPSAQNRIILLTDGAVNLGNANPESLSQMVTSMRSTGIAFDAAGISADGLNDEVLEALTRKGDGRYYLLDSLESADDGFARQIAGALRPSAKNVKVQVEFNPKRVGHYKLLGFEKHVLKKEDFRNDSVDAAEMAAAEAGVAMYQFEARPDGEGDVGSVSVRFQDLSTGEMIENRWPIPYEADAPRPDQATPSLRIATSAALLAAKLRGEPLGESVDLQALSHLISSLPEQDRNDTRVQQLQQMIEQARQLNGK
jgi:Mg-chelatase subunit ChlD